jgi:hypothetical protein
MIVMKSTWVWSCTRSANGWSAALGSGVPTAATTLGESATVKATART